MQLVAIGRDTFREVQRDDVGGLAAELAYRFFLAIFPAVIFVAALAGFVTSLLGIEDPTGRIMESVGDTLPPDAASVLRDELEAVIESRNGGLLSIGVLGALWAASSGMGSIMKAMNRAYGVKEARPLLRRYAVTIGLTVLAGLFVVSAFILLVGGQVWGGQLADELGLGDLYAFLVTFARWPVVAMLVLLATAVVYWAAPNIKLPFRWVTPGSVFFTASWLLFTWLFSLYVANFGSYNATYGSLGGIAVLLVWGYLSSYLLLAGVELNAVVSRSGSPRELEEQRQEAGPTGEEPVPQAPGPAAPTPGGIRMAAGDGRGVESHRNRHSSMARIKEALRSLVTPRHTGRPGPSPR